MSLIGKQSPQWSSKAYSNGEEVSVSSNDFKGKWHVLYFYPLDFTFICPTEIRGFQELEKEFAEDGIKVVGVSTDSFFSHKAWFADEKIFAQKITHPVLADTSHAVSRAFDVLKEDEGISYRATVIVDDKGVVRSVSVNDTSAGRSPRETLRTVQALMSGGLCGADWHKGEKFVKLRPMAKALDPVDGQNWREFVGSGVAVLMLGKTDCEACARWTDELTAFLGGEHGFGSVRFGKMLLDQRGLTDFKRDNASWLKDVDVLPFNVIYRDGRIEKSFAGSGLERLTNRLQNVIDAR